MEIHEKGEYLLVVIYRMLEAGAHEKDLFFFKYPTELSFKTST